MSRNADHDRFSLPRRRRQAGPPPRRRHAQSPSRTRARPPVCRQRLLRPPATYSKSATRWCVWCASTGSPWPRPPSARRLAADLFPDGQGLRPPGPARLLPERRGPRGPHKITPDILQFVDEPPGPAWPHRRGAAGADDRATASASSCIRADSKRRSPGGEKTRGSRHRDARFRRRGPLRALARTVAGRDRQPGARDAAPPRRGPDPCPDRSAPARRRAVPASGDRRGGCRSRAGRGGPPDPPPCCGAGQQGGRHHA